MVRVEITVADEAQEFWDNLLMNCHEVKPCMRDVSFASAANQAMCIRLMSRFGLGASRCQHFNLMSCSTVSGPFNKLIELLQGGAVDWSSHLWSIGVHNGADMHELLRGVERLGGRLHLGGLIIAHHNGDQLTDWEGDDAFVADDPNLPDETVEERVSRRMAFYKAKEKVHDESACSLLESVIRACPNLKLLKGGKCSLTMPDDNGLSWYNWEMKYELPVEMEAVEGGGDEILQGMAGAGGDDIIAGRLLLKH